MHITYFCNPDFHFYLEVKNSNTFKVLHYYLILLRKAFTYLILSIYFLSQSKIHRKSRFDNLHKGVHLFYPPLLPPEMFIVNNISAPASLAIEACTKIKAPSDSFAYKKNLSSVGRSPLAIVLIECWPNCTSTSSAEGGWEVRGKILTCPSAS